VPNLLGVLEVDVSRKRPPPPPVAEPIAPVTAIVRDDSANGSPMHITEAGIELVRRWCSEGASNAWCAASLGIDRGTFRDLRRRQPALDQAIEAGRAADERTVANVLRAKALAGDTISLIFYLKGRHHWRDQGESREGPAQQLNVIVMPAAMSPAEYLASLPPASVAPAPSTEPEPEESTRGDA